MSTQAPLTRMDLGPSSPLGILDRIGWWGALAMIAVALVYTLFMLLASRGAPRHGGPSLPRTPLFSSSSSCRASTRPR